MRFVEVLRAITDGIPVWVYPLVSIALILAFFIYYTYALWPKRKSIDWIDMEIEKRSLTFFSRKYTFEPRDILPVILIISGFMALALFNLGSTTPIDIMAEIHNPSPEHDHLTSMYFDEIYFVRTAVEFIDQTTPLENTHPPLGKSIISWSILLFGYSPFGWRLIGAIAGALMLLIIYFFIKSLFGKTPVAICGTLLLGFDFMRFVQSRIATIDTYVVLFILLSFYFMYLFITTKPDAPFRKGLLPLALSGLFFGLSFSIKWTGFYAGAGLLVIYVIYIIMLRLHYRKSGKIGFAARLTKIILFSFLFFVIVPAAIYYITYIPYAASRGMTVTFASVFSADYFQIFWNNQTFIFRYHSIYVIGATHPFSSVWWQWIFNIRPVLYVNNHAGDLRATFGVFGNPIVWLGGAIAMVIMLVRVFSHRDGKALFILIGYVSQVLPWVFVSRILFAYHYFPATIFIVLALSHIFSTILERKKSCRRLAVYGYTAVSGLTFAMFFPSISGMYMPHWYYANLIRWFSTWPF